MTQAPVCERSVSIYEDRIKQSATNDGPHGEKRP